MSKSGTLRRAHCAKYLILLGPPSAPRALLFGGDHRYLADLVDDDGSTLDDLTRGSRPCAPPAALALRDVAPEAAADTRVRCWRLD